MIAMFSTCISFFPSDGSMANETEYSPSETDRLGVNLIENLHKFVLPWNTFGVVQCSCLRYPLSLQSSAAVSYQVPVSGTAWMGVNALLVSLFTSGEGYHCNVDSLPSAWPGLAMGETASTIAIIPGSPELLVPGVPNSTKWLPV